MLSERTIESLLAFRRERDWEQFHTPRNLAESISMEAAELLEVFQWARDLDEEAARVRDRGAEIRDGLADVAIYLSYLVHDLGIDLDAAVMKKLSVNARRYPAERSRGSAAKYDQHEGD